VYIRMVRIYVFWEVLKNGAFFYCCLRGSKATVKNKKYHFLSQVLLVMCNRLVEVEKKMLIHLLKNYRRISKKKHIF